MAQIYIKIKNNPTRKIKNFPQIPSFPFLFSICNPHFAEKRCFFSFSFILYNKKLPNKKKRR